MITVVNYADDKFAKQRRVCSQTALSVGKADKVIEFTPEDIDKDFLLSNKNIFSYTRGAGLWIWKPYIITKALNQVEEGDYLMYVDAGVTFISDIHLLVSEMERAKTSVMTFELPLLEKQFTKRETFSLLSYNENTPYNQILATYLIIKKNSFSKSFIENWLQLSTQEELISPRQFTDIENPHYFIAHREDQSILSILVRKANLPVFRDPSDFGKRPLEFILFFNKVQPHLCVEYLPKEYSNSNYPVILLSNRVNNTYIYKFKYYIKNILQFFGYYAVNKLIKT